MKIKKIKNWIKKTIIKHFKKKQRIVYDYNLIVTVFAVKGFIMLYSLVVINLFHLGITKNDNVNCLLETDIKLTYYFLIFVIIYFGYPLLHNLIRYIIKTVNKKALIKNKLTSR